MSVAEAAAYLGGVSQSLVRRLYASGQLLGAKIAGRVRLKRSSVEAYLQAHSNEKATAPPAGALPSAKVKPARATSFRFIRP
jgi:excisionase family DNA binding protein